MIPFSRCIVVALLAASATVAMRFDELGAIQVGEPAAADHRISLAEAVSLLEDSPELLVVREAAAAARGRALSAGKPRNPEMTATREQLSADRTGTRYHETILALSQTIQIAGQRGLRGETATLSADAADLRVEADRLRLSFEVHRVYVRAAAAEATLAAVAEVVDIVRRVEEAGAERFAAGDISRFDRDRLRIERARYETLLVDARVALEDASLTLTLLVAPDPVGREDRFLPSEGLADLMAASPDVEVDLGELSDLAEARALEVEIDAADAALDLERRARIPDLTVLAGYKHQAGGLQGVVMGISFPVPSWDRNRGGIVEAERNLAAARARRALLHRELENEFRRAWERYRALEERKMILDELLPPDPGELLETARVAYAEGEMSLVELLDAADAFLDARTSVNALLSDYLIAAYDLERATGRLPTR